MKILLIITGSVAAYKAAEFARLATKEGHEVVTILTKGGEQFITPLQISSLTGQAVHTNLWNDMLHIELTRAADVVVVAPASADIIAKMAHGMADDLASTTLLASNKPVYVAPAMNVEMWNKPATQRNILQLENDGVNIIDPAEGELACGEMGAGKMAEPSEILASLL
jgi:phosphopantothenoylcysteine decarboxylase/phosphopantothenate--cysteine ligase